MKVILTATVTPQTSANLVLVDPTARQAQYLEAVGLWGRLADSRNFDLILVENSKADLATLLEAAGVADSRRVSAVSTEPPANAVASRGKGAPEALMIQHVLQVLDLPDTELVYKCTGRLFVPNFRRCLPRFNSLSPHLVAEIPRKSSAWVDSRLFGCTAGVMKDLINLMADEVDDRRGINMESVLAAYIRTELRRPEIAIANFREKPRFVGQSGTSGLVYGQGFRESIRAAAFPLDRMRRSFDAVVGRGVSGWRRE